MLSMLLPPSDALFRGVYSVQKFAYLKRIPRGLVYVLESVWAEVYTAKISRHNDQHIVHLL